MSNLSEYTNPITFDPTKDPNTQFRTFSPYFPYKNASHR